MKNKFYFIVFAMILINCKAQTIVPIQTFNTGLTDGYYFKDIDGKFDSFIGTSNLGEEKIICQSERYYAQSNTTSLFAITAESFDGIKLSGAIEDNCIANTSVGIYTGSLKMTITPGNPTTAHWQVYRRGAGTANTQFRVPTDAILTKVN